MAIIRQCRKCNKYKPHFAKGLCKTCYNKPYLLAFRMKPEYKKKRCEYQQTYYIKTILKEQEE